LITIQRKTQRLSMAFQGLTPMASISLTSNTRALCHDKDVFITHWTLTKNCNERLHVLINYTHLFCTSFEYLSTIPYIYSCTNDYLDSKFLLCTKIRCQLVPIPMTGAADWSAIKYRPWTRWKLYRRVPDMPPAWPTWYKLFNLRIVQDYKRPLIQCRQLIKAVHSRLNSFPDVGKTRFNTKRSAKPWCGLFP
jgi:hypothetical protein